jgi:hypothetical protein
LYTFENTSNFIVSIVIASIVRRFPGLPASPSGKIKSESEGVRMIRSSGLREGPQSFDLKIIVYVYNFGDFDSKGA